MLSGAINGSSVFLRVKTASEWLTIGGQLSHTSTESNSAIDITSKQQGHSYRVIADTEGLKTLDISGELIFSTDEAFDFVKDAFNSGSIELYQIVRGDIASETEDVTETLAKVTSWAETAPDNDKTTANITLMSSEAWQEELEFEAFFASVDGQFITSDNQDFYVRE